MRRTIRWRLRPLVVLAAIVIMAAGLVTSYASTDLFLRTRLGPILEPDQLAAVLDEFSGAFLAVAVLSILIAASISLLFAGMAARSLERLRAYGAARARGDHEPAVPPSVAETRALADSIERLADDFELKVDRLGAQRDELAVMTSTVSEGILLIGADGRILHANPAARSLLGLPADCMGQPLTALVRNAQLRSIASGFDADGEPLTTEITIDDRRLRVASRPIRTRVSSSRDRQAAGAVVAIVDLTEVRRLEGVRRDFVANVSHELKTPLTSIRGYVETLLSDDLDAATKRQFLAVIQKNADRLQSIVDDLLDLSRLESGGWRPALEDVSVSAAVDEVWETFAGRARGRALTFVPPTTDFRVLADPAALRQILSNLFDNAIRHATAGGSIRVDVRPSAPQQVRNRGDAHEPPELILIEVRDNGSGIPGDALPRIFERFYRVDPARSRAEGGTGLGLSIVKHLAESMNGDVTAASELGKGTTIGIRLPAAPRPPT